MPSSFQHDPSFTVAASNTTAGAAVKWVAAKNIGESLIILDSGGNGRIGLAGDLDLITLTANTVTVAGTVAATTLTGAGAGITALAAANITASGTLPALVGTALTALDASNLSTGTLPAARIAADSIVEAKLDVSNGPTNGQFLQAQSGEGGGLTWAAAGGALQSTIVGGSQLASGILLYSHNDAPTTTTITGAGFAPTAAIIFYGNQHTEYGGVGFADDANVDANWARNALKWVIGSSFIVMDNNGTNAMSANLTSLDSNGCTLSWLKYGSGVTVDYRILFLR